MSSHGKVFSLTLGSQRRLWRERTLNKEWRSPRVLRGWELFEGEKKQQRQKSRVHGGTHVRGGTVKSSGRLDQCRCRIEISPGTSKESHAEGGIRKCTLCCAREVRVHPGGRQNVKDLKESFWHHLFFDT